MLQQYTMGADRQGADGETQQFAKISGVVDDIGELIPVEDMYYISDTLI